MDTLSVTPSESAHLQQQINALLLQAFPDTDGDSCEQSKPWKLVLGLETAQVVAHVAIYIRPVLIDGAERRIGLLGDVAVAPEFRRMGIARRLIAEAHRLLIEQHINFAVLFAFNPDVYASSGYAPMENETRFIEAGQTKHFVYRGGMVSALGDEVWDAKLLDLQGEAV